MVSTYAYTDVEQVEPVVRRLSGGGYFLKLTIDRVVAAALLLLVLPVMATLAVLIKLDSPGPVFYRQLRVGRHGRLFWMYKYRSMIKDAARYQRALAKANGLNTNPIFKLRQDPRVTRMGRWLRQASLDELPQLLNVLRGEMSLVGPRPPLVTEVTYEWLHMSRLEAMPGMTGLWQVSGRSSLPFEEMRRLDLHYINEWSLVLDFGILVRTIPAVLSRRGAY